MLLVSCYFDSYLCLHNIEGFILLMRLMDNLPELSINFYFVYTQFVIGRFRLYTYNLPNLPITNCEE